MGVPPNHPLIVFFGIKTYINHAAIGVDLPKLTRGRQGLDATDRGCTSHI